MKTHRECRELAIHYELSAERAADHVARQQLQTLAQSYFVLATSISVLERSAKLLGSIGSIERRKAASG
jgi:hypothetical protein